jgi:hypothetical protein
MLWKHMFSDRVEAGFPDVRSRPQLTPLPHEMFGNDCEKSVGHFRFADPKGCMANKEPVARLFRSGRSARANRERFGVLAQRASDKSNFPEVDNSGKSPHFTGR